MVCNVMIVDLQCMSCNVCLHSCVRVCVCVCVCSLQAAPRLEVKSVGEGSGASMIHKHVLNYVLHVSFSFSNV